MLQDKNDLNDNNLIDNSHRTSLIDTSEPTIVSEPILISSDEDVSVNETPVIISSDVDNTSTLEDPVIIDDIAVTSNTEDVPIMADVTTDVPILEVPSNEVLEDATTFINGDVSPISNEWDSTVSLDEAIKQDQEQEKEQETINIVIEEKDKEKEEYVNNQISNSKFGDVRYNPVTGEEMNINDVKDEVNNEEKLKTVEVQYKGQKKGSTFLLVVFFLFMLGFIIFLPDLVSIIDAYRAGKGDIVLEEIPTGKLVCTLETNTINLDKSIERVFYYDELKLKSAKFSTNVRGDATLDEETLQELYDQCSQIKENVSGMEGINISCDLSSSELVEKESFDYAKYDSERVSAAYVEAGGSLLEFELDQDIDRVMSIMKQGGFKCVKEK